MGQLRYVSYARLTEILRRQDPPKFGPAYEPAIKPTREEAPSKSRPAPVWSEKLGREVSTLSRAERAVLAIILYCCLRLFELQEQRMLPFLPSSHPLLGHPIAAGLGLKPTRGTLQITNELQYFRFHPVVNIEAKDGAAAGQVPGCWIGDYLVFVMDQAGPYCVNINVKSTRSEFNFPQVGVNLKTDLTEAGIREKARHETERVVYADFEIPTIEVSGWPHRLDVHVESSVSR